MAAIAHACGGLSLLHVLQAAGTLVMLVALQRSSKVGKKKVTGCYPI